MDQNEEMTAKGGCTCDNCTCKNCDCNGQCDASCTCDKCECSNCSDTCCG